MAHFPAVRDFIRLAHAAGGKVLLHGNAGISRSGALLIAYIMESQRTTYNDAFRIVQAKRFCVSPNEGFQSQLLEYEPIYRAMQMVPSTQAGGARARKRGVEEGEAGGPRDPATFGVPQPVAPLPGHAFHAGQPSGGGAGAGGGDMEM